MQFLRTALIIVMLACALCGPGAIAAEPAAPAPVVIDVRSEQEWQTGHLEGAVLIPHEQIAEGIAKVVKDKKTKIYLHCRSGRRSDIALESLRKSGYENVINLGSVENASRELGRAIVE